jgi:23S rRNA (adenine1618-N6)-methyltransferase
MPSLGAHLVTSPSGDTTIDFSDASSVKSLNGALLKLHYGIEFWDIPAGFLCPPIPGRADYIHHIADLLSAGDEARIPRGDVVSILDVGTGANCVYPIIGVSEYGWRFVATDIDRVSWESANQNVERNAALRGRVDCRLQKSPADIFSGIVRQDERFHASICNPPFHASAAEAAAGTERKVRNLGGSFPKRNFGGRSNELWCEGGEVAFIRRMIQQSTERPQLCKWFTTLVSKSENLSSIQRALRAANVAESRVVEMAQGQKKSRFVAWRF